MPIIVADTFADGPVGNTPITAAKLNNIENAIVADDVTNPASQAAMAAISPLSPSLPNLLGAIQTYNDSAPATLRIIGLGSSVGVGATLPDPTTQAPSAYFTAQLGLALNRLGNLTIALTNGSVNGSVITGGVNTDYAAAKVTAGGTPTVTVLAYGMNDGTPNSYHSGQTYPGIYNEMKILIAAIRADGGDPIVLTTPHPQTGTYPWTTAVSGITYPTTTPIPALTYAASVVTADWTGTGTLIPVSYRHLRANQAMRQAAYDAGCPVIDAERYWFRAVATYGEPALFNSGEIVHPNLLGHQNSYWLAINDFMRTLIRPSVSTGLPPTQETPWTAIPYVATWADYGGAYQVGQYRKDLNGIVELRGLIKGGATGTQIATLPVGFRPSAQRVAACGAYPVGSVAIADISTTGLITGLYTGTLGGMSLDGIRFHAA